MFIAIWQNVKAFTLGFTVKEDAINIKLPLYLFH